MPNEEKEDLKPEAPQKPGKPEPIVTEEEIERVLKELEEKEKEKEKTGEEIQKRMEEEKKKAEEERKKEGEEEKKEEIKEELLARPKPSLFKNFFKYLFTISVILGLVHFGLNYKTLFLKGKYLYERKIKKKIPSLTLPKVSEIANLSDSLIIPKISLKAPIIWETEEKDILNTLKQGLAHYKLSALPIEEGNAIIFGHSSYYPFVKGEYNQVFALLSELKKDDQILIVYQKKGYVYKVLEKKIVRPEKIEILTQEGPDLTLITCWPYGTTLYRLVVIASKIGLLEETEPYLPEIK